MFKSRCQDDSFLQWLHALMLMDDTVILATTRERLQEKLNVLDDFCQTHGMVINQSKTKFMAINGDPIDKLPLHVGNIVVLHCDLYVYLGTIFTSDGNPVTAIFEHVKSMQKHFLKLVIFLKTNKDMPFIAKRKVVDAAFNAAILYGCESWLNVNFRCVEKMYISAIKCLLSVRKTAPNEPCLVEAGFPPLVATVKQRQQRFFTKMFTERAEMHDDPLMFLLKQIEFYDSRLYSYISNLSNQGDFITDQARKMYDKISSSTQTKLVLYNTLKPFALVHPVYTCKSDFVPEFQRIAFTRMRLSSHNLKIETGRWSRLLREQRLCKCGLVQDERHVLTECDLTKTIRDDLGCPIIFPDCLQGNTDKKIFKYIYDITKYFDDNR